MVENRISIFEEILPDFFDFQAFEKTACPYRFLINLVDFLLKIPMVALKETQVCDFPAFCRGAKKPYISRGFGSFPAKVVL